jgi:hypothetical protein
LLLVREAAIFSNRRDSIRRFLQPTPCCVYAYCLDGFRRSAAARLGIKPGEVPGAHVYTFRKRLDPKVAVQMLRNPLFQFA